MLLTGAPRRRLQLGEGNLQNHNQRIVDESKLTSCRFDFMVLPLLMLGFFSQQIDRGNMYAVSLVYIANPRLLGIRGLIFFTVDQL